MKFTKKQRREIYEKAYVRIKDGYDEFICGAIGDEIDSLRWNEFENWFYEFGLFKPERTSSDGGWFGTRKRRLIALLFMIELTKD
jgi:hypothetical protein